MLGLTDGTRGSFDSRTSFIHLVKGGLRWRSSALDRLHCKPKETTRSTCQVGLPIPRSLRHCIGGASLAFRRALRHARRGGDYEFVITSHHPSPAVLVQDDAPFGSNNRRLHDCPDMFHIVHPSNIHHLALVRPRTIHSTTQSPRPVQVRLLFLS
jgi:hypothetical protein